MAWHSHFQLKLCNGISFQISTQILFYLKQNKTFFFETLSEITKYYTLRGIRNYICLSICLKAEVHL